ncbi:unnamed protein product [Prunus armeniaca]
MSESSGGESQDPPAFGGEDTESDEPSLYVCSKGESFQSDSGPASEAKGGLKQSGRSCWSFVNLAAWCSGPRGCTSTCDVLLLDAVRLCVGVPARSTVRRDDDEVRVEDGLNVAPVLRSTPNQTIVAERCSNANDCGRVRNESRPSGSRPELQGRLVVVLVVGFRRCSNALLRERRSYDIWGE